MISRHNAERPRGIAQRRKRFRGVARRRCGVSRGAARRRFPRRGPAAVDGFAALRPRGEHGRRRQSEAASWMRAATARRRLWRAIIPAASGDSPTAAGQRGGLHDFSGIRAAHGGIGDRHGRLPADCGHSSCTAGINPQSGRAHRCSNLTARI